MSYASRMKQGRSQPPTKSYAPRDPARAQKRATQPRPQSHVQRNVVPSQRPIQPKQIPRTQARPQARAPARPQPPVANQGRNQQERLARSWESQNQKVVKIRKISSGDTIICELRQGDVISVTLDNVQAPRIARNERAQESFFAYEAREFLRKKFVGCLARVINHSPRDVKNVREGDPAPFWGNILIAEKSSQFNNQTKWVDLTRYIVEHGWADVKDNTQSLKKTFTETESFTDVDGNQSKDEGKWVNYWETLRGLSSMAKQNQMGKFAPIDNTHLRVIDKPDVEEFFNKYRGKRIPAVVDEVREGSTIRCEMNVHVVDKSEGFKTSLVFIHMSGIESESMPKPVSVQKNEWKSKNESMDGFVAQTSSAMAKYGKATTTKRLLHQDVEVRLDNCVGNRLYGTIFCAKGDIGLFLLLDGMAEIVDWHLTADKEVAYNRAQNQAIEQGKGKWKNVEQKRPRKKQAMEKTRVTQVRSGDCVVIGDEPRYLASIRCPRSRNPRNDSGQDFDQAYHYEAKEFVRAALVGNDIKVKEEYEREGKMRARKYVSIFYLDGGKEKNISEELVKQGYAEKIPHARADPRASNYAKLHDLEKIAKEQKKGKWSMKKYSPPQVEDYSDRRRGEDENALIQLKTRAAKFVASLGVAVDMQDRNRRRGQNQESSDRKVSREMRGIVDYCVQATKLKITLVDEKPMKKIFLFLSGVKGYDKDTEHKGLSDKANDLVRGLIQQKEVWVVLEGVDQWSNFLGQVVINKQGENLACMLLNRGYAEVYAASAERSPFKDKLVAAELLAKEAKIGRWENWNPEEVVAPTMRVNNRRQDEAPKAPVNRVHPMQGVSTTAFITHIDNAAQFFVNLAEEEHQDKLQKITEHMNSVNPATVQIPDGWVINVEERPILAALFHADGNYYRFRVTNVNKRKEEKEYKGLFIDFGNTEWIKESELLPLDPEVAQITPQALKCTLAALKPPMAKSDYFSSAGAALDQLAYNRQLNITFLNVLSEWRGKYEVHSPQSRITLYDVEVNFEQDDEIVSVNKTMTHQGMARIDEKKVGFYGEGAAKVYLDSLREAEKIAQDKNFGMYQYGVGFDSDDEDDKRKKRRF